MTALMDYPDGQGFPNQRGPVFAAQGFDVTNATPVTTGEWVTNFASVYFSLNVSAGAGVTVTFGFFTDQTLTMKTAAWAYAVTNQTALSVCIPALGNFFTVEISTAQAGHQIGAYSVVPCSLQHPVQRYPSPVVPQFGNVTVPASSTSQFGFNMVQEGSGILNVVANDASGKLYVSARELSEAGAAVNYLRAQFLPAVNLGELNLPFIAGTNPVQINLQNTDGAAAHTCTFYARILAQ